MQGPGLQGDRVGRRGHRSRCCVSGSWGVGRRHGDWRGGNEKPPRVTENRRFVLFPLEGAPCFLCLIAVTWFPKVRRAGLTQTPCHPVPSEARHPTAAAHVHRSQADDEEAAPHLGRKFCGKDLPRPSRVD